MLRTQTTESGRLANQSHIGANWRAARRDHTNRLPRLARNNAGVASRKKPKTKGFALCPVGTNRTWREKVGEVEEKYNVDSQAGQRDRSEKCAFIVVTQYTRQESNL